MKVNSTNAQVVKSWAEIAGGIIKPPGIKTKNAKILDKYRPISILETIAVKKQEPKFLGIRVTPHEYGINLGKFSEDIETEPEDLLNQIKYMRCVLKSAP
ncbi:hypothetical protein AYI70_g8587 [Smittium culicis]|uniref:Uncharacterized protein n=1 Tax=Smittium culicis TaxID=133412 RepID=A0A1R1XF98_9FUNG|nr:hypothetical protein AYI70_g8587 [Smittium culicis]